MRKLTDRAVKAAGPGRHMDRTVRGLSLLVQPSGARSWVLRYQLNKVRREMGLGPYPEVTLAMARTMALDHRRTLKVGKRDPLVERRAAAASRPMTFREVAEALVENKHAGWGAKHARQWTQTLVEFVYPKLGTMDVQGIEASDVIRVLKPIWAAKTATASRVRARIEAVLDYAKVLGKRTGDSNPARWKGNLDHTFSKPSEVAPTVSHAALDWREAPAFMAELARREGAG